MVLLWFYRDDLGSLVFLVFSMVLLCFHCVGVRADPIVSEIFVFVVFVLVSSMVLLWFDKDDLGSLFFLVFSMVLLCFHCVGICIQCTGWVGDLYTVHRVGMRPRGSVYSLYDVYVWPYGRGGCGVKRVVPQMVNYVKFGVLELLPVR